MEKNKKQKIGILTYHNCFNYGAFLQAYALQNFLKENGYDNLILNYKNKKHWFREYKIFLHKRNIKEIILNLKKIIAFKKSYKKLNLTKFTWSKQKINSIHLDSIVVGSDTVWDFNTKLIGKNTIYFGDGFRVKKLISYAPSFGSIEKNFSIPKEIKNNLNNFTNISVRDNNSKEMAEFLTNKPAQIVVDPVLLYESFNEVCCCPYDNFILIYLSKIKKELIEKIRRIAKQKNKKIISVGFYHNWCDINRASLNPFEWLGYIKKSNMIITNMFHGALFSIKFNKEFCLIINPIKENKFNPILEKLGLINRIFDSKKNIESLFNDKINYKKVNLALKELVKQSKKYLINALNAS